MIGDKVFDREADSDVFPRLDGLASLIVSCSFALQRNNPHHARVIAHKFCDQRTDSDVFPFGGGVNSRCDRERGEAKISKYCDARLIVDISSTLPYSSHRICCFVLLASTIVPLCTLAFTPALHTRSLATCSTHPLLFWTEFWTIKICLNQ